MHFFVLVQLSRRLVSYALLVAELHKRFTPVHLKAVQSSLFHDQKQNLENW